MSDLRADRFPGPRTRARSTGDNAILGAVRGFGTSAMEDPEHDPLMVASEGDNNPWNAMEGIPQTPASAHGDAGHLASGATRPSAFACPAWSTPWSAPPADARRGPTVRPASQRMMRDLEPDGDGEQRGTRNGQQDLLQDKQEERMHALERAVFAKVSALEKAVSTAAARMAQLAETVTATEQMPATILAKAQQEIMLAVGAATDTLRAEHLSATGELGRAHESVRTYVTGALESIADTHADKNDKLTDALQQQANVREKRTAERINAVRDELLDQVAATRDAFTALLADNASAGATPRGTTPVKNLAQLRRGKDGPDDDEVSLPGSVGDDGTAILKIPFPKDTQLAPYKTDMTRDTLQSVMPELREFLEDTHPAIEALLHLDEGEYRAAIQKDPTMKAADTFVRQICRALTAHESPHAKVFRGQERTLRDEDPKEARCGRALLARMEQYGEVKASGDVRVLRKRIEKNTPPYVTVPMTEIQVKAAHEDLRADIAALPKHERTAFDPLRQLARTTPDAITYDSTRTLAERLEDELDEHELLHPEGPAKWKFAELSAVIAKRVADHSSRQRPGVNVTRANGDVEPCDNCGCTECDGWSTCPKRCATSKLKGCDSLLGGQCICTMAELPNLTALNKERRQSKRPQMRKFTYDRIADWREKHPDKVAAAPTPTAAPTEVVSQTGTPLAPKVNLVLAPRPLVV